MFSFQEIIRAKKKVDGKPQLPQQFEASHHRYDK
jgi:hypothetical protein